MKIVGMPSIGSGQNVGLRASELLSFRASSHSTAMQRRHSPVSGGGTLAQSGLPFLKGIRQRTRTLKSRASVWC